MRAIIGLFVGFGILANSCAGLRQSSLAVAPGPASHDTLLLSKIQYDSVYVFRDRMVDRTRDTLLIENRSVEYRYKLLRDTVYRVQIDSIPVIREVEVVKEVKFVPWYLKGLSLLGGGFMASMVIWLLLRVKF